MFSCHGGTVGVGRWLERWVLWVVMGFATVCVVVAGVKGAFMDNYGGQVVDETLRVRDSAVGG